MTLFVNMDASACSRALDITEGSGTFGQGLGTKPDFLKPDIFHGGMQPRAARTEQDARYPRLAEQRRIRPETLDAESRFASRNFTGASGEHPDDERLPRGLERVG